MIKLPILPLSDIVNVSVVLSPVAAVRSAFNLGLIVGNSSVISTIDRVKLYSDTTAMVADGFTIESAEYKAATFYFGQTPRPAKVAIGRWDSVAETAVAAITACRAKNTDWYACTVCGVTSADILNIAAYIETTQPSSAYFYTTADAAVLAGTALAAGYETGAATPSTNISAGTATTFQIAVDADVVAPIVYNSVTLTLAGLNTGALIAAAMQTAIRALGGIYAAVKVEFVGG
ncbi:MAG: hypothetical protein ACYC6C_11790, partial [Coriobacteriia bacterium]